MRLKSRWYLCQVDFAPGPPPDLTATDVYNAVRAQLQDAFGEVGFARVQSTLAVKHYSAVTRLCLVRGPAEFDREVHASLALVRAVRKQPAAIRCLQKLSQPRTLRPAAEAWHAALVSRASASAAGDALSLDSAWLAAVEQELAEALGGGQ
jgi:RNase P/RNase MRP subunit POP5